MALKIYNLTCNHTVEPLGVDDLPHFSYVLSSDVLSLRQNFCRIHVRKGETSVWDSGWIQTDAQVLIPYTGPALSPMTRYDWSVTVKASDGACYSSSESFFETGVMQETHWPAKWITADNSSIFIGNRTSKKRKIYPASYLRKSFELKKPAKDATLYISGVGYYECYVNGQSLKDTYLDPAFTEYDKAVLYKAHKVTGLRVGQNALGIILGDGFFNADSHDLWNFYQATWRSTPRCILLLRIEYEDGTFELLPSDDSFRGTLNGPIRRNDVRTQEIYDARMELCGWNEASYDDSSWEPAKVTKAPGGKMKPMYSTPIRKVAEWAPTNIEKKSNTTWIFDAGFNTAGWATLSMHAPRGTELQLRYLEQYDEELKDTQGLATCLEEDEGPAFQTDRYIAKGEDLEVWHPLFKYNGYRYIIVECEDGIPEDLTLTIEEIRTDLPVGGAFTCSDERINRLQELACRSTATNFHHMPTDCPHREKNGWTGDAQLSAEQLLYNFDGAAAYARWMEDVVRAQRPSGQLPGIVPSTGWGFNWGSGPAWDSACAIIPYTTYLFYGDARILKNTYPTVKRYLEFCKDMAKDSICAFGLGDWCPPRTETHQKCNNDVTDTGYYYLDTVIASKMAAILGYRDEAAQYEEAAKQIRADFRRHFIRRDADGVSLINCQPSQTAYATILYHGMQEPDEDSYFFGELKRLIHEHDDHLDVGILGLKYVNQVLLERGEIDLLLRCHLTPTYPSLGYMLACGATTLWETFEGKQSQNHHMFGDISATFYKALAGIEVDENAPGFRNTLLRPQFPTGLQFVKAWHDTPYGRLESAWTREGEDIQWTVTIPLGCTGKVTPPKGYRLSDAACVTTLEAGTHVLRLARI